MGVAYLRSCLNNTAKASREHARHGGPPVTRFRSGQHRKQAGRGAFQARWWRARRLSPPKVTWRRLFPV